MSKNQADEQPMSARSEILSADKKRSYQAQPRRSASQRISRPSVSICCTECKLPLLIDINKRDILNKSRAGSAVQTEHLCQECTQEKDKNERNPSSRLFKSPSLNWSNMNDNIETWFEKARTPDQRVVYNFLQQINEKASEKTQAKDLDNVLNNLKKYQARFNSSRPRSKFTRLFESSSWRVMRNPTKFNQTGYGNESANDSYAESIFVKTDRKMGSTFLIHPSWI